MTERLGDLLDAVLLDIGGTLLEEAPPHTPVADLRVHLLADVARDLGLLAAEVPLAAVTNTATMSESDVRSLLATVGVDHHLVAIVTSADVGVAKPDPAPILVAMARLGLDDPTRVLFIGDTRSDAAAARAAGVEFARVLRDGLLATVDAWMSARRR